VPDSIGALAPSLQHLRLEGTPAPASLDELTGLPALHPRPNPYPEPMPYLIAALPRLAQLTSLALVGVSLEPWVADSVPACLPHLTGLQRLAICDRDTAAAALPLSSGQWAARLRWLAADWLLLLKSSALLGEADQLEHLVSCGPLVGCWTAGLPGTLSMTKRDAIGGWEQLRLAACACSAPPIASYSTTTAPPIICPLTNCCAAHHGRPDLSWQQQEAVGCGASAHHPGPP